jgi:hypothetical protein
MVAAAAESGSGCCWLLEAFCIAHLFLPTTFALQL